MRGLRELIIPCGLEQSGWWKLLLRCQKPIFILFCRKKNVSSSTNQFYQKDTKGLRHQYLTFPSFIGYLVLTVPYYSRSNQIFILCSQGSHLPTQPWTSRKCTWAKWTGYKGTKLGSGPWGTRKCQKCRYSALEIWVMQKYNFTVARSSSFPKRGKSVCVCVWKKV